MRIFSVVILATIIFPLVAIAHASGEQFILPLPVSLYIGGGMTAFVASCVVLLLYSAPKQPQKNRVVFRLPAGRLLTSALGVLGLFLSAATLFVAFVGDQSYISNPAPILFWTLFLLLFAYISTCIAGFWRHLDPFRNIVSLFVRDAIATNPPAWLPYMPTIIFFTLLWLELFSPEWATLPMTMGILFLAYAALSVAISKVYGISAWYGYGDFFTAFFGIFEKVSLVQIVEDRAWLMWPGERLVHEQATRISTLVLILVMLGSTIFDGLRETAIWWNFVFAFNLTGLTTFYVTELSALFLIPAILFGFYTLAIYGMRALTSSPMLLKYLCLRFAFSLIPIAVAYHFAHYFSLILSEGTRFIAQLSDPFNNGSNFLGTANLVMNTDLISVDTIWYTQLGTIVLGHIFSALIAHRISQQLFATRKTIILSQLPMLVLMVFYTAFGLWTLAQPFVG